LFGFTNIFAKTPETIAAVDLGSNSFHMIVARVEDGQLQIIDRLREMVRLGAGLDENCQISVAAQDRALACLERFGQRLRAMPPGSVRAAGTNTLRMAKDSGAFIRKGERVLGHPIEIIAGLEEARLIYLGVAHGLSASDERRLVVDIGGGSTEVIVGEFTPSIRESLHMGCVSMSRTYFDNGRLGSKQMDQAEIATRLELRPVRATFSSAGWHKAVGCSGTIRSIRSVVHAAGWCDSGISLSSLMELREVMLKSGRLRKLDLEGLSDERKPVFPGGFCVLLGVFKALGIDHMEVSDEAMREGLLYDLLGRLHHEDIRERTVQSLSNRYVVDEGQAVRVRTTALNYLDTVAKAWGLEDSQYTAMLGWAALLHEIGLSISHSQYQKHGAYIVENSDLSGFSLQEQMVLAALLRGHRRKLPQAIFNALPEHCPEPAFRLCVLLRLAVLMHRSHETTDLPSMELKAGKVRLDISFPSGWLDTNPLTYTDLQREIKYLKAAGFTMTIS
jgi:exopolyphosphatase/guanosine-5'-triphosphate,3'-diphosphate pyrophosphatase